MKQGAKFPVVTCLAMLAIGVGFVIATMDYGRPTGLTTALVDALTRLDSERSTVSLNDFSRDLATARVALTKAQKSNEWRGGARRAGSLLFDSFEQFEEARQSWWLATVNVDKELDSLAERDGHMQAGADKLHQAIDEIDHPQHGRD
jgi:hypothetical protein